MCLLRGGDRDAANWLTTACDRYAKVSLRYTGRIIPRVRHIIEILGRSVGNRSVAAVIEAADHMSQGWSDYVDSTFPLAFELLARTCDDRVDPDDLRLTSYTSWQRGLVAAAAGDAGAALAMFERSLERYAAPPLLRRRDVAIHRRGYGDYGWRR